MSNYEPNPDGDPIVTARNLLRYERRWEPTYEGETPPGRCPEHYPDDGDCPDEGRVGAPRTTSPWVRRALHKARPLDLVAEVGEPVMRYPWRLDEAVQRGWDRDAHAAALQTGDVDAISITHPANWLTEDEIENPAQGGDLPAKRYHV